MYVEEKAFGSGEGREMRSGERSDVEQGLKSVINLGKAAFRATVKC
jgi:hypothetical protein